MSSSSSSSSSLTTTNKKVRPESEVLEIAKRLVSLGRSINMKNSLGETMLMTACRHSHRRVIKFILENSTDTDTNVTNENNATALTHALRRRDFVAVDDLLRYGADFKLAIKEEGLKRLTLAYSVDDYIALARCIQQSSSAYSSVVDGVMVSVFSRLPLVLSSLITSYMLDVESDVNEVQARLAEKI